MAESGLLRGPSGAKVLDHNPSNPSGLYKMQSKSWGKSHYGGRMNVSNRDSVLEERYPSPFLLAKKILSCTFRELNPLPHPLPQIHTCFKDQSQTAVF